MNCYVYNEHGVFYQVPGSMNLEPVKAENVEDTHRNHSRMVQQLNAAFAMKTQLDEIAAAYREMLAARTVCDIDLTKSANRHFKTVMEVTEQMTLNLSLI